MLEYNGSFLVNILIHIHIGFGSNLEIRQVRGKKWIQASKKVVKVKLWLQHELANFLRDVRKKLAMKLFNFFLTILDKLQRCPFSNVPTIISLKMSINNFSVEPGYP